MIKFSPYLKDPFFWIVFFLIIGMGSIPSMLIPYIWIDGIIVCLCIICIRKHGFHLNSKSILPVLLFLWIWFFLDSVFTIASFSDYSGLCLRSFEAVLILGCIKQDFSKFINTLYLVLWGVAVYGAINFLMYTLFPYLFVTITTDAGYVFNTFSYIFFVQGVPQFGHFSRNLGLFWEPGVFQIPLNILIYLILIAKRKPLKVALLPLVVLITNSSTTGLILMICIIMYRIFIIDKKKVSFSFLFFGFVLVSLISPVIYYKFVNNEGGSFGARAYDFLFALKVIADHPLFGIGNRTEIYNNMIYDMDIAFVKDFELGEHSGNTNTIVAMFMYLGFPVWFVIMRGLVKQKLFPCGKLFTSIILLSLCSEPLLYTTFIWLISLSGYIRKSIHFRKNEIKNIYNYASL